MITLIRYMSIAANVAFMVFLGFLIYDEAGTLRWLRGVNQLWFFFGALAVIVLAAIAAEWLGSRKPKATHADQAGSHLRPAA